MKQVIFTGAATALVTPFDKNGEISWEELEKLIEFQIEGGIDAIVACGTTGEAATMTTEEHTETIRFIIDKVKGRVPVIAGTGSNDTKFCVELSQEAKALGADGLLLVTPYYNKTSQKGLIVQCSQPHRLQYPTRHLQRAFQKPLHCGGKRG